MQGTRVNNKKADSRLVWCGMVMMLAAVGVHADEGLKPGSYFVHGSWVNVRAQAAVDSPVNDHVITNTAVTLLSHQGGTCEIAWGKQQHGFIACKMLGDKPVVLSDINRSEFDDGKPNPHYSPLRAFWIAPSVEALFAAGKYFQETLLTKTQNDREQGRSMDDNNGPQYGDLNPAPLVRYPVPEFEAMKGLLASGIVAPEVADVPCAAPLPPSEFKDGGLYIRADCRIEALPELSLPRVQPSLFRSRHDVAGNTNDIDTLSGTFTIPEAGRSTSRPRWELDYDTWRYTGAWDIGRFTLTLAKPVVEEVIGRTGLVGAYQWKPTAIITPNDISPGCDDTLRMNRFGKDRLPDYPNIKDELIVFEAPGALPYRHAHVSSRVIKPKPGSRPHNVVTFGGYVGKIVVYNVDLDNDGVPDFVEWDIWDADDQGVMTQDGLYARFTFVNIKGQWYLLDSGQIADCT